MSENAQKLSGASEQNILTALVWLPDACVVIARRITPSVFSTRGYRVIAETAIAYIEKYHKAPGIHCRDELDARMQGITSEAKFLVQTFEAMDKVKDQLDQQYILDNLDQFIKKQTFINGLAKAADHLAANELREAKTVILEAMPEFPSESQIFDPWGEVTPPNFNPSILPPVLSEFVRDRAAATGADPAGIAWAALSACSAAMDGSIRQQMNSDGSWEVPPGLWVLLYGESSAKKTPILKATWGPLEAIQHEAIEKWKVKKSIWDKADKDDRGPEPRPTRYLTTSATTEAIQDILSHQNRGFARYVDEWASLIGEMEKYAGSKGGAGADRAFMLQTWNGGPYYADRVKSGRGMVAITNCHVVNCGGIQPDRLRELNKDNVLIQDGFLQRAAVIILKPPVFGNDRYSVEAPEAYKDLIRRMTSLDGGHTVSLSKPARQVRERLERRLAPYRNNNALGMGFRTFVGKLPDFWGRLTLIVGHILASGYRVDEIGVEAAEIAEKLILESLLLHAARFYEWLGGGGDYETTRSVAGWILTHPQARVRIADLKAGVRDLRAADVQTIQKAVSPLVAGGWLTPDGNEFNPRAWKVNQDVFNQFRERAVIEKLQRNQARELIAEDSRQRRADYGECNDASLSPSPQKSDKSDCAHESGDNLEASFSYSNGKEAKRPVTPRAYNQICHITDQEQPSSDDQKPRRRKYPAPTFASLAKANEKRRRAFDD